MEFVLTHPDSGLKQILVIFDGVPYEADSDHLWWDEIVRLCLADDPRVLDLFPIRSVQKPSEEVPFVRPGNDILVEQFAKAGYTIQGLTEAEGYSLEDLRIWMDTDPSLFTAFTAAIEHNRHEIAFPSTESRWLPHNIETDDEEGS